MSSDDAAGEGRRIETIDAARGVAMLVVFLAHFSDTSFLRDSQARHRLFALVTRIASPAFVWLSGMMLGLVHHRNSDRFGPVRDRMIDRGLFLILVGHPLIACASRVRAGTWLVMR